MSQNDQSMPLTDVLVSLNDGEILEDLKNAVRQGAIATLTTGKISKIVLAVELRRSGSDKVTTKAGVKVTLPEPERGEDLWYVTTDGGLSRRNPAQMTLSELKDAN